MYVLSPGDIECLGDMGDEFFVTPGRYVDKTHVVCPIPSNPTSTEISIMISFTKRNEWTKNDFKSFSSIAFEVYAMAPVVLSLLLLPICFSNVRNTYF